MGRKALPEQAPIFLSGEPITSLIEDAKNLSRWNPSLAMKFMETAALQATNPVIINEWNKAATFINNTIASIESQHYYRESEYWNKQKPTRLTPMTSDLSLEDYIAMKQFSG